MELVSALFNEILYRPLFSALVFLYVTIPGRDFGVAIICLTVLTRIILYPLSWKAIVSQKALSRLQPQIRDVQEKYKHNREGQTQALMRLYQEHKVNPFSGCLPLLIQIPIFIALYQVFQTGLDPNRLGVVYSFIHAPSEINPLFLRTIDLSLQSSKSAGGMILAFLAGVFQFVQSKTLSPTMSPRPAGSKPDFSKIMQDQMMYMLPVFTVMILWNFKSGLALYWITTSVFSIIQQMLVNRRTTS